MTKQNLFEQFWKKWDALANIPDSQTGRPHGLYEMEYAKIREEFASLCEKEAKKADQNAREWNVSYIQAEDWDKAFSNTLAEGREIGKADAFRLVAPKVNKK